MKGRIVATLFATAVALLVAGCVFSNLFTPKFELVGADGAATIVLPANAEHSTTYAARVLVEYVEKMTGKRLKVVDADFCPRQHVDAEALRVTKKGDSDSDGRGEPPRLQERGEPPRLRNSIIIGTLASLGDAVPADVAAKLRASKQYEASWTGVRDGTLWFVGKETPGEHYAVCHFIETKLGVRWFAVPQPEDPGEYVPKADALKVEPFELYREPLFRERRLSMVGCVWYPIPTNAFEVTFRAGFQPVPSFGHYHQSTTLEKCCWMDKSYPEFIRAHAGLATEEIGGGHSMFEDVAPKSELATHPEFFPLVGSNRVWNSIYCVSNTNLLNRVVDRVIATFGRTGGGGHFLFGMADTPRGWCECPDCKALDSTNRPVWQLGSPDVATRFGKAVEYMAPKILAKFPNADLRRWAYHDYRKLPRDIRQNPKVDTEYCTYCRCHGHTLDDPTCKRNADMLKEILAWKDFTGKGCYLYDYLCCNSEEYYNCCEKKEQADIKLYKKLGLLGWKNEMCFQGAHYMDWVRKNPKHLKRSNDVQASNWRFYYVVGRLLWDDAIDVDKMLDEVDRLYYGPAAEPMCAYQRLRRKLWNNSKACFGYPWGNPRTAQLLNDLSAKEQLLKYLDEAEKLVEVESPSRRKEGDLHSPTPTSNSNSIYRHRIAQDRDWLNEYWIKPNDRIRAKMGSAYTAPRPVSPIVIDGTGDERAWTQAYFTDAFRSADGEHPSIPDKLKTSVGILTDMTNLYFLVTAREPNPGKITKEDAMTFFLYPPAAENLVYRFTAGVEGAKACAVLPSGEARAIPFEAKTVVGKDAWTMEVKVPVRDEVHPLRSGDTWRVLFGRTRGFADDAAAKASWTTDGTEATDVSGYHRLEIDRAHLENGSFEDLDEKGQLAKWWGGDVLDGTNRVRLAHADGSGYYLKYEGTLSQEIKTGPLARANYPRKFKFSFRAKNAEKGKKSAVDVYFIRFKLFPPQWGQGLLSPHGKGGDFKLTDEWKTYTGEYTIAPEEWIWFRMRVHGGKALLDDVQVIPE